jgi:hypothetical protein
MPEETQPKQSTAKDTNSVQDWMREGDEILKQLNQTPGKRTESPNQWTQRISKEAGIYPVPNLAVELCVSSYTTQTEEALNSKDKTRIKNVRQTGKLAYCAVLPKLNDAESVREFIACVVHGIAINAIPSTEGTRLLYGAQVAQGSLPPRKKRKKRAKSALKDATESTPTATESAT